MLAVCLSAALLASPVRVGAQVHTDGSAANDVFTDSTVTTAAIGAAFTADAFVAPVHLTASYSPVLRYGSGGSTTAGGASIFETLQVGADSTSGRLGLFATLSGSAGQQDFSPIAQVAVASGTAPPPPIDRLPQSRFLTVATLSAAGGVRYRVDPRLSLATSLTLSTSGGLGSDATKELPRQYGASASGSAAWLWTRLDSLSASASVGYSLTELSLGGTQRATFLGLQLGWTRRLDPTTSAMLAVGMAATVNPAPAGVGTTGGTAVGTSVLPTAAASISRGVLLRAQTLAFTAHLEAGPQIDPLTGLAYVEATGGAGVNWGPKPWLGLTAALSAGRTLGGPFGGRWGAVAEVSGAAHLNQATTFNLGVRGAEVPLSTVGPTGTLGRGDARQWTVFAGLTTGVKGALR